MSKKTFFMLAVAAVALCVLKSKHCQEKEQAPAEKAHAAREPETLYDALAGWAKSKF